MREIDIVFIHWANCKGNCFFNAECLAMIVFRICTQIYSDIYLAFQPFDIITAECEQVIEMNVWPSCRYNRQRSGSHDWLIVA